MFFTLFPPRSFYDAGTQGKILPGQALLSYHSVCHQFDVSFSSPLAQETEPDDFLCRPSIHSLRLIAARLTDSAVGWFTEPLYTCSDLGE
jgi:hypothetical protein